MINYIGISTATQTDAMLKARELGVTIAHAEGVIQDEFFDPTHLFAVTDFGSIERFSRPIAARGYVASASRDAEIRFY